MIIQEQIAELRKIEDDQNICGVDCGRTGSCNASYQIGEAADTMEKLLAVYEAAEAYLAAEEGGDTRLYDAVNAMKDK